MDGISFLGSTNNHVLRQQVPPRVLHRAPPPTIVRGRDIAELSRAARVAGNAAPADGVRHDLVARVRAQIARGSYETDEKIEAIVGPLGADLARLHGRVA